MKLKLYTRSHDINLLQEVDRNGGMFTAKEHAYVTEMEQDRTTYQTRESLLRWYLAQDFSKLPCIAYLARIIKENQYRNIVSFGSGHCVLEYLLQCCLPEEAKVVASDYDAYMVGKATQFFPEITAVTFDFSKDDIKTFQDQLNIKFDLAIFFGSAFCMDDPHFICTFSGLNQAGVKRVIDFHAGCLRTVDVIRYFISLQPFRIHPLIRKLFCKPPVTEPSLSHNYQGKFCGYRRNKMELRKLYQKSGLEIVDEISIGPYRYVAILR